MYVASSIYRFFKLSSRMHAQTPLDPKSNVTFDFQQDPKGGSLGSKSHGRKILAPTPPVVAPVPLWPQCGVLLGRPLAPLQLRPEWAEGVLVGILQTNQKIRFRCTEV